MDLYRVDYFPDKVQTAFAVKSAVNRIVSTSYTENFFLSPDVTYNRPIISDSFPLHAFNGATIIDWISSGKSLSFLVLSYTPSVSAFF